MKYIAIYFLMLLPLAGTSVRIATMNVLLGTDSPGEPGYEALKDILARLDADIVSLQEVRSGDSSGTPSSLGQLASDLGYPYLFIPSGSDFDTSNDVILLSRFPFTSTFSIGSPTGAKDITRVHPAAIVDVPGTDNDPMIIGLHLKCCFEEDDFFRRAVEVERIMLFLNDQELNGSDNIIVMGDFNLLGNDKVYNENDFQNLSTLPTTYNLGNDISFPVNYFSNPVSYFTNYPLLNPMPLQQNGISDDTFQSGSVLDYIIVSQAIFDRGPILEVYNSAHEANFPGLPKSGPALPASTSSTASDHYPIFGDFNLDSNRPLNLIVSDNILSEGGSTATLTVSLPEASSQTVTVLLSSSDPDEAIPSEMTLTFPPGVTSQSTTLIPKNDKIIDGSQNITFTASAAEYGSAQENITLLDTDTPTYELTEIGSSVTEDFTGFAGTETPAKWSVAELDWLGNDDGSSEINGLRSYGSDGSFGVQSRSATSISGDFHNLTGETITALTISYQAEQWHSSFGGSVDRWEVDVITSSGTFTVPALTFSSDSSLTSGAIPNGTSNSLGTTLAGLAIPPNETFQIIFNAISNQAGTGRGDAIFINEIHYDNSGFDTGEFIEVVVGPDFTGRLSEVDIVLYNGGTGESYGTHALSSFSLDTIADSGHQIYSKEIPAIQNGGSDGIAIIQNDLLLQFLSYEGSLTATAGPASGATSTDIGVSQSSSQLAGEASIGLIGEGSAPEDFTWTRFTGSFTKGTKNEGQDFGRSIQSQGIAFDNLQVTPLSETSLPTLSIHSDFTLSFPSQLGLVYQIETSTDLDSWTFFDAMTGNGNILSLAITNEAPVLFFRLMINK